MFVGIACALAVIVVLGCSSDDTSEASSGGAGGVAASAVDAGGSAGNVADAGGSAEATEDLGAITMTQIEVGNLTFDVRVAGPEDGEVVFLLHGFPETSHEWRDVMPVLGRAGYRVVAPDQRGYSPGARPAAIEDYAVVHLVTDIIGMADAIGADRFHIAGHDWGAAVTWGVATVFSDRVITASPMSVPHPDAFSSLLADPTSDQYTASQYFETFSQPDFEDTMLANDAAVLRAAYAGFEPGVVEEYIRVLGTKEALGAALNWYRANVAGRTLATGPIGPTPVPTMFIWSDGDIYLVREGVDLTANYVTGPYRLEIIEGIDHWLVDREPDQVADLLLSHMGG